MVSSILSYLMRNEINGSGEFSLSMTKIATICFLRRQDEVLLIYKKRGFGEGKYNGPGGKVTGDETPEECAIREVEEELGYKAKNLSFHGVLVFYFGNEEIPSWEVHVFQSYDYAGQLKETEEAKGYWTKIKEIPYDKMWADDKIWLPDVLNGETVNGTFWFSQDTEKLLKYQLKNN